MGCNRGLNVREKLKTPFSFDEISILFVTIISRGTYICLNSGVMAQTFQSL